MHRAWQWSDIQSLYWRKKKKTTQIKNTLNLFESHLHASDWYHSISNVCALALLSYAICDEFFITCIVIFIIIHLFCAQCLSHYIFFSLFRVFVHALMHMLAFVAISRYVRLFRDCCFCRCCLFLFASVCARSLFLPPFTLKMLPSSWEMNEWLSFFFFFFSLPRFFIFTQMQYAYT